MSESVTFHPEDTREIIEIPRPTRPLLYSVGVLDFNDTFSQLQAGSTKPYFNNGRLGVNGFFTSLFELKSQIFRHTNDHPYVDPLYRNKHYLYELTDDGVIATIARTSLFKKLFGKYQLGLNRNYPLPNDHNRGEHSIYLAINAVRSMQHFFDTNPNSLVVRLKKDFAEEDLVIPSGEKELVFKGTALTAAVCMLHDLATPAGGDTLKYLLGMSEEVELGHILIDNKYPPLSEDRTELLEVLDDIGLDERDIRFVTRCVQGKSDSLIGEIINPKSGDKLDFDRMAYTYLDCDEATILDYELPQALLSNNIHEYEASLAQRLIMGVTTLIDNPAAVLGIPNPNTSRTPDNILVPMTIIDCSENFFIDRLGRVVCSAPEKLAWTAAFRLWMVLLNYGGSQMLGLEWELQQKLQGLRTGGKLEKVLTVDRLIGMSDDELFQELGRHGDGELKDILDRRESIGGTSLFSGRFVDRGRHVDDKAFASFPIKLKPGFDSSVSYKRDVITLGAYLRKRKKSFQARALLSIVDKFKRGKRIDIYKRF